MAYQQSSSAGFSSRGRSTSVNSTAPDCLYGQQSPLATSWTAENLGRRFYGCANFRSGGCGFFRWYDAEVCERGKDIMIWLNEKKNQLRESNGRLRAELTELRKVIQNLKSSKIKLFVMRFIVLGVIVVCLYWITQ